MVKLKWTNPRPGEIVIKASDVREYWLEVLKELSENEEVVRVRLLLDICAALAIAVATGCAAYLLVMYVIRPIVGPMIGVY